MSRGAFSPLRGGGRDPAVTLILLLPLALLHLAGFPDARGGAFSFVLGILSRLGPAAVWVLGSLLLCSLLWALGRIRRLEIPWQFAAGGAILEGVFWGLALGPALLFLTSHLPLPSGPLLLDPLAGGFRVRLALAAGAGLYEELLFRALLLGGLAILLRSFFQGLGWESAAATLGSGGALVLPSLAFALAHGIGDPQGLGTGILVFRFLAGVLLGLLYGFRGLAVVAYAHAAYDAFLIL